MRGDEDNLPHKIISKFYTVIRKHFTEIKTNAKILVFQIT